MLLLHFDPLLAILDIAGSGFSKFLSLRGRMMYQPVKSRKRAAELLAIKQITSSVLGSKYRSMLSQTGVHRTVIKFGQDITTSSHLNAIILYLRYLV